MTDSNKFFMEDSLRQAFSEECDELLERMEHVLLEMEADPNNSALIDELFRIVHTIKGSSGLVGFEQLVDFSHELENLAVQVRDGVLAVTQELCDIMLESRDLLLMLVDTALGDEDANDLEALAQREKDLTEKIQVYSPSLDKAEKPNKTSDAAPEPNNEAPVHRSYVIDINLAPEVLMFGLDPLASILYLQDLGTITKCVVNAQALPSFDVADFTQCYLSFELEFESDRPQQDIEDAFMFLRENGTILVKPVEPKMDNDKAQSQDNSAEGKIASPEGGATLKEVKSLGSGSDAPSGAASDSGSSNTQNPSASKATAETVRVDAQKLGGLIDLVGELVIANANTHLLAKNGEVDLLTDATEVMLGLVEDIRDTTLSLRMVQIGTVFNRFKRIVREANLDLGKAIDLQITGGDTELDKTIVDKISDPLTHMIRNALDHGIESPEGRLAAGKPEVGTIKLDAYHDSGVIVIEIVDDGKGLDKERILARAEERGIISDRRLVPDRNVYDLIFYPGFSTAETVTNLSGRGVGMDVVKKNIDALNGHIDVESETGKYTKISIRLPLTLAIIDGFLFEVEGFNYVVPLDMVDECVEFSDHNSANYVDTQFINLRGEIMPFMRLKDCFGIRNPNPSASVPSDEDNAAAEVNPAQKAINANSGTDAVQESAVVTDIDEGKHARESVIVIRHGNSKSGIVVDKLLGEYQTVIKPLGRVFNNLEWLSGATILGNGDVAIIIDVLMLIKHVFAQAGDDERWLTSEAS